MDGFDDKTGGDDIRIFKHDLISDTWSSVSTDEWEHSFADFILGSISLQAETFGGSFYTEGDAARGRVTVRGGSGDVLLDVFWRSAGVAEARRVLGSAISL